MTYYKAGSWNCTCQVCGFQFKSDEIKKRWDGLLVCSKDYETRHPQELIRAREEKVGVPFVAPEPADVFIDMGCTFISKTPRANMATAGCATVGFYNEAVLE